MDLKAVVKDKDLLDPYERGETVLLMGVDKDFFYNTAGIELNRIAWVSWPLDPTQVRLLTPDPKKQTFHSLITLAYVLKSKSSKIGNT